MNTIEIEFWQPADVVSENELRRAARSPKGRGAAIALNHKLNAWKDEAEKNATLLWKLAGVPCRVQVELEFAMKRNRDPHNYVGTVVKSIVDGLVRGYVWEDDNPEWVTVDEPILTIRPHGALRCRVRLTRRG